METRLEAAVRKRLDAEPWGQHISRLTLYAQNLIRQRTWRGARGDAVPGGKEAADFALEVVADLLSGTRKWNPEAQPQFIKFLFDAVKSEVYNAVVSKSNQDTREDPGALDIGQSADDTALELLDYVSDGPQLTSYVEAIIDGYETRGDIAEHLNLPSTEVDNLRRRMARRLDDYYGTGRVRKQQGDNQRGK